MGLGDGLWAMGYGLNKGRLFGDADCEVVYGGLVLLVCVVVELV